MPTCLTFGFREAGPPTRTRLLGNAGNVPGRFWESSGLERVDVCEGRSGSSLLPFRERPPAANEEGSSSLGRPSLVGEPDKEVELA